MDVRRKGRGGGKNEWEGKKQVSDENKHHWRQERGDGNRRKKKERIEEIRKEERVERRNGKKERLKE